MVVDLKCDLTGGSKLVYSLLARRRVSFGIVEKGLLSQEAKALDGLELPNNGGLNLSTA